METAVTFVIMEIPNLVAVGIGALNMGAATTVIVNVLLLQEIIIVDPTIENGNDLRRGGKLHLRNANFVILRYIFLNKYILLS
jgi:hypothetical protein